MIANLEDIPFLPFIEDDARNELCSTLTMIPFLRLSCGAADAGPKSSSRNWPRFQSCPSAILVGTNCPCAKGFD